MRMSNVMLMLICANVQHSHTCRLYMQSVAGRTCFWFWNSIKDPHLRVMHDRCITRIDPKESENWWIARVRRWSPERRSGVWSLLDALVIISTRVNINVIYSSAIINVVGKQHRVRLRPARRRHAVSFRRSKCRYTFDRSTRCNTAAPVRTIHTPPLSTQTHTQTCRSHVRAVHAHTPQCMF